MNIYLDSGYCDIESYLASGMHFILVTGGRGIGKTYGALKYCIESGREFILLRRTQAQIDIVGKQEFSPFKALERDMGIEVVVKSISKYTSGFFIGEKMIGIAAALSTFSNLRGFSTTADLLIYDEFIPERHERPIKEEGAAFLNVIESAFRNNDNYQVLCLANANDIGNPIFMELELVKEAEKLRESGKFYFKDPERSLLLIDLSSSPISKKKAETPLYKLAKDSSFKRMALNTEFITDSIAQIKSLNLRDYTPLVVISGICFYEHKSERKFYVSEHISGTPERYTTASADIERFRKEYYYLYGAYLGRKIIFENRLCSVIFEKLW